MPLEKYPSRPVDVLALEITTKLTGTHTSWLPSLTVTPSFLHNRLISSTRW